MKARASSRSRGSGTGKPHAGRGGAYPLGATHAGHAGEAVVTRWPVSLDGQIVEPLVCSAYAPRSPSVWPVVLEPQPLMHPSV